MHCPRIDHFVRFNEDGTVSCCGHMKNGQRFDSLEAMHSSNWVTKIKTQLENDQWPDECVRCEQVEKVGEHSIRMYAVSRHASRTRDDYLQVGGVLDNVCNLACQMCSPSLSSKLASLNKVAVKVNNLDRFFSLPQDRITHLDINGGEPSYSKNYQKLLHALPPNLTHLRVNTNCMEPMLVLENVLNNGIDVTVTVSFDGTEKVHNYVRYPSNWENFVRNIDYYRRLPLNLNLWSTVSSLNIIDFPNMMEFARERGLSHSWALLHSPMALSPEYKNSFTLRAKEVLPSSVASLVAVKEDNQSILDTYIKQQDKIRKINIADYIDYLPGKK